MCLLWQLPKLYLYKGAFSLSTDCIWLDVFVLTVRCLLYSWGVCCDSYLSCICTWVPLCGLLIAKPGIWLGVFAVTVTYAAQLPKVGTGMPLGCLLIVKPGIWLSVFAVTATSWTPRWSTLTTRLWAACASDPASHRGQHNSPPWSAPALMAFSNCGPWWLRHRSTVSAKHLCPLFLIFFSCFLYYFFSLLFFRGMRGDIPAQ